jgi:hypothetical protein
MRMSSARPVLILAMSVALTLLTPVRAAGQEKVPVKQWAKSTCKALATYQRALAGTGPALGPTLDPTAAKEAVVELLDDAVKGTKRAVRALEAAGAPDVRQGAAIAATFVTAFERMRTTFARSRSAARELPAEPTAFLTELDTIEARIQGSMTRLVTIFEDAAERLDVPIVSSALRHDARCQAAGLS